jgi:hypothetical protein
MTEIKSDIYKKIHNDLSKKYCGKELENRAYIKYYLYIDSLKNIGINDEKASYDKYKEYIISENERIIKKKKRRRIYKKNLIKKRNEGIIIKADPNISTVIVFQS